MTGEEPKELPWTRWFRPSSKNASETYVVLKGWLDNHPIPLKPNKRIDVGALSPEKLADIYKDMLDGKIYLAKK